MTALSLNHAVDLIASELLDSAVKGTVLLGVALLATLLLRRAAAATRHLVLVIAMTALLAMPVLSPLLPGWHIMPAKAAAPAAQAPLASVESHGKAIASTPFQKGEARIIAPEVMDLAGNRSLLTSRGEPRRKDDQPRPCRRRQVRCGRSIGAHTH